MLRFLTGRRIAIASAATVAAVMGIKAVGFHVNVTDSLPLGIYRAVGDGRDIHVGQIAVTCLPLDVARLATQRGYLPRGDCPGGVLPVGKPVVAGPGDTVEHRPTEVRVNGRVLPRSATAHLDRAGRPLPRVAQGIRVLGPDEFWIESSYHPRSFDSRYYGPVTREQIRKVVKPVLTW